MGGYYPGVLNTGKRRYAHPALAGSLPTPWCVSRIGRSAGDTCADPLALPRRLPLKKGESLLAQAAASPEPSSADGVKTRPRQFSVVLSLGRKVKKLSKDLKVKGKQTPPDEDEPVQEPQNGAGERIGTLLDGMRLDVEDAERNPWRDSYQSTSAATRRERERAQRLRKKLSFDPATVRPPASRSQPWSPPQSLTIRLCPASQGVIMLPHSDEDSDNGSEDDIDDDDDARAGPSGGPPAGALVRSETTPLLSAPASGSTHRPYFPHKRARTASSPAAPATLDLKAKGAAARTGQPGPSQ